MPSLTGDNPTVVQYRNSNLTNGGIPENQRVAIGTAVSDSRVSFQLGLRNSLEPRKIASGAASQFDSMINAMLSAVSDGGNISFNSAYRDHQGQVNAKGSYGTGAATPGTSPHGWGVAVDIQFGGVRIGGTASPPGNKTLVKGFTHAYYTWLHENAHTYGWYNGNPDGRLRDAKGSIDEWWHWEYWGPFSGGASTFGAPQELPFQYQTGSPGVQEAEQDNTRVAQSGPAVSRNVDGSDGPVAKEQAKAKEEDSDISFQALFDQIQTNLDNIEQTDTDATWGKRSNPQEDSDWIALKQFLLYLGSKFSPQSMFPFVDLIPVLSIEESQSGTVKEELEKGGYLADGKIPKDLEKDLEKSSETKQKRLLNTLKFVTELPPGFNEEKFNQNARMLADNKGNIDLFTLDPFQQGYESLYKLSESGQKLKAKRGIGMRIFGQLQLTPKAIDGVPSKPGAIGFTEVEVNAGSQSDNGLALITMKLLDVQGNKFNDINSPWAFIFDVRPGSQGGDFYFRYGWQIRIPDGSPQAQKTDSVSRRFWNHPGWKVFPDSIKQQIIAQLPQGKNLITLSQSVDTCAMFDDGIEYDEETGQVSVRKEILQGKNSKFVRLAILNPELEIDPRTGAVTASLQFRTTGAIAKLVPIVKAVNTRNIISKFNYVTLAQLLIVIELDSTLFGVLPIDNQDKRKALEKNAKVTSRNQLLSESKLEQDVFVTGIDTGGNRGKIDPNDVFIKVPKKLRNEILSTNPDINKSLIRWFRQVLQENDCELLSAATGSGAGINSAYIITTTQNIEENKKKRLETVQPNPDGEDATTARDSLIDVLRNELDVFAFRFQGSLVESINIAKTDAPNAMKIQVDFNVGDFATNDSTSQDDDAPGSLGTTAITAADRKRNLLAIFSQMQNCQIEAIAHPWIGPGSRFYLKGMGFYDGEYLCLQVTHRLVGHKFTSSLEGARILLTGNVEKRQDAIANVTAEGNGNMATDVTQQTGGTTPKAGGVGDSRKGKGGANTSRTLNC